MFHSFGYRGHTIHIAIPERSSVEEIKVQLSHPGGRFDLVPCKTVIGAKRAITRFLKAQAIGDTGTTERSGSTAPAGTVTP